MNYTVIARRWRPKRFEDVIGQPHIITTIKNSLKFDRIAHAYLFTGPRGVGKTSLARIVAKAVNCTNRLSEEPCGACESCLAIDDGNFVDIIEIDAASKTGVDDIRELTESVRYMPMKGAYKVYILDESHMLSKSAVSALLKTLEEPPGHNIFVLATTELQKIPYTIMSRCQRFDFRRIPEREIITQLKRICDFDAITYDETAFDYIAAEADGSLRDAESVLEQVIAYSGKHISERTAIEVIGVVERATLYSIVQSVFDGDLKRGLGIVAETLDRGYDVQQIYKGLISILRNMMVLKVCEGLPSFVYMSDEEYNRNVELLKEVEYYEIQNMLYYLLKQEDLLKGLFPKISLELLYVNLYNLSKLRDVDKIIDKLDRHGYEPAEKEESVEEKARSKAEATVRVEAVPAGGRTDSPHYEQPVTEEYKKESPDPEVGKGKEGFLEYVKVKTPFIGNLLSTVEISIEQDNLVIFLDRKHRFMKDSTDQKEEIKQHLKGFFGKEMGIEFRDAGEIKKSILEEFVKEAETLFKI